MKRPTTSKPSSVERKFRPDIEGLRAIAVLLVILDHAGVSLFRGGYVGVDLFFVLSGFLITGLLIREIERTGRVSLTAFYARRARRLLPAGTLVLVLTVLASYVVIGGNRAGRIAVDARWTALFASNFRFIQQGTDYLDSQLPPSPLQHFWSLAVEEQFYFVWPALIIATSAIFRRISLRLKLAVVLGVIILASIAWSIYQTSENGTAAYFSPFTRAHELAAGALLAVVTPLLPGMPRRLGATLSWLGLAMVIVAGVVFSASTTFPGFAVLLPVIGTILAVAGGTIAPEQGAERVLRLAPFQLIGRTSYSLYLWHWPLLVIIPVWIGHDLETWEKMLVCLAAFGFSLITYFFIEQPIRESDRLKSRSPIVSVGMGAGLVAASLAVIAITSAVNPPYEEGVAVAATYSALPDEAAVLSEVNAATNLTNWPSQPKRLSNPAYSKTCNVTRKDTASAACVHGDPNASRTVVVYGDSHAAMWIPAFDLIGKSEGWRVVQLTKPGCQAADFPRYSSTLKREYTECAEYREWALGKIDEIRPDMIIITSQTRDVEVMSGGDHTTDGAMEAWSAGLGSVIDRVSKVSKRVVLLGDMAYPNEPGIDCLTAHPNDIQVCGTSRDDGVDEEFNALEERVALEHRAEYVDVILWFCTETRCPPVIGGLTVHRDQLHIGENFAVWLSIALGSATGMITR